MIGKSIFYFLSIIYVYIMLRVLLCKFRIKLGRECNGIWCLRLFRM